MRVELLYFDGCPSFEALLPRLAGLLAKEGFATEVALRRVESIEDAERERFLGSPTVRIDGEDIESAAASRTDYGLKCRLYRADGRMSGTPPDEWIVAVLRRRGHASGRAQ